MSSIRVVMLLAVALLFVGCGPSRATHSLPPRPDAPGPVGANGGAEPSGDTQVVIVKKGGATEPRDGKGLVARDAEVSASAGEYGGIVLLWPRIIPATDDPAIQQIATRLQKEMRVVAQSAAPSATIDVRPAPERVCPQGGCDGVSIGMVLAHAENSACVVVGYIAEPSRSPAQMFVLAGGAVLDAPTAPFREPVENYITVKDFSICSEVLKELDTADLERTLRATMP